VVAAEELHVTVQADPAQHVHRRSGAEPEPRQLAAQLVALLALGLRHGEHHQHPSVGRGGPPPTEDPGVAVVEDLPPGRGERVAGAPRPALGGKQPAALEPRDRRADGGLVHPEPGQQPHQRSHGQPAVVLARIEAVERDDQLPWLADVRSGAGPLRCFGDGGHA
jgi:hypothetical protein